MIGKGGTDAVQARPLPNDPAVQGFVDGAFEDAPVPAPDASRVEMGQIRPGDPVIVAGRARSDRRSGELALAAVPGVAASLVFSNTSRTDLVRRAKRRARRNRVLLAAGALAVLSGLAVAAP